MDKKLYLIFVLLCIIAIIIGISVYYIYTLVVPYQETDILLDSHYMKGNPISYKHDDVFDINCETGSTYMFWCNIDGWEYKYNELKPILVKGSYTDSSSDMDMLQSSDFMPGIFLGNSSMSSDMDGPVSVNTVKAPAMLFTFKETDSSDSYNKVYELLNIPLQKWFHISVCIYSNVVELYMDGELLNTIYSDSNLIVNHGKLRIGEEGGFDGSISKLAVFSRVISSSEVRQRYLAGPTTDVDKTSTTNVSSKNDTNTTNNKNNDIWETIPYNLSNESGYGDDITTETPIDVVTLYSQPYLDIRGSAGSYVSLPIGSYTVQDLADLGIKPATISGVKFLEPGYMITLYTNKEPSNTDRKADYLVLRDTSDWDGALKRMNNKARSLKIEPDPYKDDLKATFYKTKQKRHGVRLPLGKYTKTDLYLHGIGPTDISSYDINGGYQAALYEDDFFTGNWVVSNKENSLDKLSKVSSLKLEKDTPDGLMLGCEFFENKNYSGKSFRLSYGEYTMYDLLQKGAVYEDINSMFILRSVTIPPEYNVLLYPRDQFMGIPQRLKASTKYIQAKLFHLSIVQSIKIVKADEPIYSFKAILDRVVDDIMN